MNHNKLYARLIVDEFYTRVSMGWMIDDSPAEYRKFIRTQARKNNCYAMALREIGG